MTHCPECRTPILSLMMLDARNEPEYYCERCAAGYPVVEKIVEKPRQPALV
jgi:uncharacterized protein YbaR (Trm112 family)